MSANKQFVLLRRKGSEVSVHGSRLAKPFTKESDAQRSISKRRAKANEYEIMEILP